MPPGKTGGGGYAMLNRSTAQEMMTPISCVVNINHQHMSTTSSLKASHAASLATINDQFTSFPAVDADALPSPKKAMTDFSRLKTNDDSVACSGDSADWEKDDERVQLQLLAAGDDEDADDITSGHAFS